MKLKSASCQIAYWQHGKLCLANYLTGRRFSTQPLTLELIRYFFTPRTIEQGVAHFGSYEPGSVAKLVLQLIEAQLLLEYRSEAYDRDESVRCTWGPWLPEGSFHFMVKDTPFLPRAPSLAKRLRRLPSTRAPPLFKEMRGTDVVQLPSTRRVHDDTFFQTVHRRRTHRTFARGQIPLAQISELLQTTWGAHGYIRSNLFGKLLHKTSPSAAHDIPSRSISWRSGSRASRGASIIIMPARTVWPESARAQPRAWRARIAQTKRIVRTRPRFSS